MSLRNTQKPLKSLLSAKETASVIVAVPAGMRPSSVMTATYDAGLSSPIASNKVGSIGALSPFDGTSSQPVEVDASTVELITRDSLLKVGECADCSSDLYADNATADAMQEHVYLGACVMCGGPVSYANTGELAQIATSVERDEQGELEVANYFDFTELNTVDPNTVEENDMSTQQARKALRASIASAMRDIKEKAAADDDSVAVVPSDDSDEDFAEEDDGSGNLETMDMDESDPSEDEDSEADEEDDAADGGEDDSEDGEDTSDEEAAVAEVTNDDAAAVTNTDNNEEASDVANATVVEAPVADAAPAIVDPAEETEQTNAPVLASEETPAAEAPVAEAAPAGEVVVASDDTTIEYVATTPAQLSPDAELVPVSESAYYVIQDEAPVAILRKENASAGAQSLWHKPVELRNAYRASLAGDREVAFANFGGKVLTHSTNVAGVVAERIAAREQAAAVEVAAERQSYTARMRSCLETAALGINKGMFGAQFANPVASQLAAVLEVNGVREPRAIVTASMSQSMPSLIELLFTKASELAELSEDALAATATMVGNSDFIAPVTTIEAPAVETPAATIAPVETASVAKKPSFNMDKLFSGVGKQAHVGVRR